MKLLKPKYTYFNGLILFLGMACSTGQNQSQNEVKEDIGKELTAVLDKRMKVPVISTAADLLYQDYASYQDLFQGKRVGIVTNQTGIIPSAPNQMHLVDFLLSKGVNVQLIFSPEHGFRGKADAGEIVKNGKDIKTGLSIISLYGKNKKPYVSQIQDLDVILFDIQDVGVRFYTYISTLAYVMEAAAENGKKVIVLDRPNPNGHYIDGPIMQKEYRSFVGLHPVPIVYGMTMGEYAKMVNGEGWLKNGISCDLEVVELKGYTHASFYDLPVLPSPNLPNAKAINLYPSLCYFEGTHVSCGRGTSRQFQLYGSPFQKEGDLTFVPKPNLGAKNPKFNGETCRGEDLSDSPRLSAINLEWLIRAYKNNSKSDFFTLSAGTKTYWIDKLSGSDQLRKQVIAGKSQEEIKATWQVGLVRFKKIRAKYLLYR